VTVDLIKNISCTKFWRGSYYYTYDLVSLFLFFIYFGGNTSVLDARGL